MEKEIIEEGYKKALEVLHKNVTKHGFSASTEKYVNYYSVWSRDHSICSISAALTNDVELINTAIKGIFFLLKKQNDSGQVPSYVEIENQKKVYGGLGSITSIDSNMWLIIASSILYKKTKDKRFLSDGNIRRYIKLFRLLKAFDSDECGFIEVPKAGDWADIFSRDYHVLYDECLYYQALKELSFLFQEKAKSKSNKELLKLNKYLLRRIKWIRKKRALIKRKTNDFFWLTKENIERIKKEYMIVGNIEEKNYNYYVSHLEPFKLTWAKRFESFGNILAIITGIANNAKSKKIIKHVKDHKINEPFPLKSLYPPVYKNEKEWEPIYATKEKPYTYHNGGIWPMMTGFWINALIKNKNEKMAKLEMEKLAIVLKKQKWTFNEYMHGKTKKPLGRTNQAWSAAGYIIGYHSIKHHNRLFF